jgi:hypothetical protein
MSVWELIMALCDAVFREAYGQSEIPAYIDLNGETYQIEGVEPKFVKEHNEIWITVGQKVLREDNHGEAIEPGDS